MAMADPTDDPAKPGYADALAELEAILTELEDGEVDIDLLAAQVRRAAELLELCRERVDDARVEVTRIVAQIDEE
jgi:exodeoxyribonuclease VII small subunit